MCGYFRLVCCCFSMQACEVTEDIRNERVLVLQMLISDYRPLHPLHQIQIPKLAKL